VPLLLLLLSAGPRLTSVETLPKWHALSSLPVMEDSVKHKYATRQSRVIHPEFDSLRSAQFVNGNFCGAMPCVRILREPCDAIQVAGRASAARTLGQRRGSARQAKNRPRRPGLGDPNSRELVRLVFQVIVRVQGEQPLCETRESTSCVSNAPVKLGASLA